MQNSMDVMPAIASDAALSAMFEARKRVFVDMLGWQVPVINDAFEIDQFDGPHAAYIVIGGPDGSHRASARLLPTLRPHILANLFPALCSEIIPSRGDIWEITRFCIEPKLDRRERRTARNELVSAIARHSVSSGIASYTAVAVPGWFRQIAQFGWRCRALGPVKRIGEEDLIAMRIDINTDTIERLTESGIYTPSAYRLVEIQREVVA